MRRKQMTSKEHFSLRIRACSLIYLSELKRKSSVPKDSVSGRAKKRLSTFAKKASKEGCAIEDITYGYIFGCIWRKKALYGVNFPEALELYEKSQLCKKIYNQPSQLYREIKKFELKNQEGVTQVFKLEKKCGHFVKGKYLYDIAGKELAPLSARKGSSYTRYIVQEETRVIIGTPPPEKEIFLKEINKHWFKIIISVLRKYKSSLEGKSRDTLDDLIKCPFSAEYLSSSQARKDKGARLFAYALDNLHRNSLFRKKISRVDYLNLLRKYNDRL
jgi:hypothetical protein